MLFEKKVLEILVKIFNNFLWFFFQTFNLKILITALYNFKLSLFYKITLYNYSQASSKSILENQTKPHKVKVLS